MIFFRDRYFLTVVAQARDRLAKSQCLLREAAIELECYRALAASSRTTRSEKLQTYAELYRSLGGYPYDRDPGRPNWYPLLPNTDFADPNNSATPDLGNPLKSKGAR